MGVRCDNTVGLNPIVGINYYHLDSSWLHY